MQVLGRKRKAHSATQLSTPNTGPAASRFVSCPVCDTSVPAYRINEHLDACTACGRADGSAQPDGHAHQHPCQMPEAQQTAAASHEPLQEDASCGTVVHTAGLPESEPVTVGHSRPPPQQHMHEQRPATAKVEQRQSPQQPAPSPQRSVTSVLSAPAPLVFLRRSDGRKVALSDERLKDEVPCELVRDVLPRALATELLKVWFSAPTCLMDGVMDGHAPKCGRSQGSHGCLSSQLMLGVQPADHAARFGVMGAACVAYFQPEASRSAEVCVF